MKNFSEWENLSFSPFKKKIGGFAPSWDKAIFNLSGYQDDIILRDLSSELYQIYRTNEIPFNRPDRIPTFNFSHAATELAIKNGFPENLVINSPKLADGTRKISMHKKLADKSYVPKTAYSVEEAIQSLKFPIIAKASESQSAKGVYQYKTPQELLDAKIEKIDDPQKKPDLFCEKIEIVKEFRLVVYIYKNQYVHLLYMAERIPDADKIKDLREGVEFLIDDAREKDTNFEWELINPTTEVYSDQIKDIIYDCIATNPGVKVLAIDFCVDDQNKWWYIECNMHPGMSYYLPVSIYYHAFSDYYSGTQFLNHAEAPYQTLTDLAEKYSTYTHAILREFRKPSFPANVAGKRIKFD